MIQKLPGPQFDRWNGERLTGSMFYVCSLCGWAVTARPEMDAAAQNHWTDHFAHSIGEKVEKWLEIGKERDK